MSQPSWLIPRRTLLRGAVAALGLPLLECMRPLAASEPASAGKPPVRTLMLYFANGVPPDAWFPKKSGSQFDLPQCLAPLAPIRDEVLVFKGLKNPGVGSHENAHGYFTCLKSKPTTGADIAGGGVSMDQVMAKAVGQDTPLPSIEIGTEPPPFGDQKGYSAQYFHYMSWASPTEPMAREINPRALFERMFGAKDAQGRPLPSRPAADDRSLIDLALGEAKSLRPKLGTRDANKLDEYLEALRGVERRVEFSSRPDTRTWRPRTKPELVPPPLDPKTYGERLQLMLDLAVLALQTDTTRVITLLMTNEASDRSYSGLVPGLTVFGHHTCSHSEPKGYAAITTWQVAQFVKVCQKMRAIDEGGSSLLDNSMVTLGTAMLDGRSHNADHTPMLMAGRAGGTIAPGRYLPYPQGTTLSSLYLGMLRRMGVPAKSFAGATDELPALSGGDPPQEKPKEKPPESIKPSEPAKPGAKAAEPATPAAAKPPVTGKKP
ncbi:hypothetical protein LBMAG53_36390 [Planctomycetota bacterium]|nr:hypothetical protein LBMAG53_36390 [Planctomycetota bacterium]